MSQLEEINKAMKLTTLFTVIFLIFLSDKVYSYGLLRSPYGAIVQWPGQNPHKVIYLNVENSHGINDDDIERIFSESINQWNSLGNIRISFVVDGEKSVDLRNDVYFSE